MPAYEKGHPATPKDPTWTASTPPTCARSATRLPATAPRGRALERRVEELQGEVDGHREREFERTIPYLADPDEPERSRRPQIPSTDAIAGSAASR